MGELLCVYTQEEDLWDVGVAHPFAWSLEGQGLAEVILSSPLPHHPIA